MERFSSPDREGSGIHTRDSRTVCEIYGLPGDRREGLYLVKRIRWRSNLMNEDRKTSPWFLYHRIISKVSFFRENASLCHLSAFNSDFLRSLFKNNIPNVSFNIVSQLRKKNFIGCRSRSMNNQPLEEVILKDETTNVSKFAWFFFPFRISKRLDKTRLMDRLAHITQRATRPLPPRLQIV